MNLSPEAIVFLDLDVGTTPRGKRNATPTFGESCNGTKHRTVDLPEL
jgi:hypothetical protein